MAKKRKTRQEKIILQLKRELAQKEVQVPSLKPKTKPSQGAISFQPKPKAPRLTKEKKTDISTLSHDSRLIKKDLAKTLILTLIALSLQLVLYLRLR